MATIEVKLNETAWQALIAGLGFPNSRQEAEAQGYRPLQQQNTAHPKTHNMFIDMLLPNMVVLRNPTNTGACGVTFDESGRPIPVYLDPGTGLCNSPYYRPT